MSLRSGLLAESTWALDALNIMLYDDSTVAYFHLKHFPGLLNCLLEHFLKSLRAIFRNYNHNSAKNSGTSTRSRRFDSTGLFDFTPVSIVKKTTTSVAATTKTATTNTVSIPNGHKEDDSEDVSTANSSSPHVLRISYTEKEMNKLRNKQANAAQQHTVGFNDSRANLEWYEYNREMLEKYNKTDNKQPTTTIVEQTTTTTTKKLKKEPKEPRENNTNNTNSHNSHHHTNNNSHHTNSHHHHHNHHNHQHHHSHNHVNNSHHTNDESSHYNHTNNTDIDSKSVSANENCHVRKEEKESQSFDDEYILTNFYPEEEDSLERLFYGEAFLKQRRELEAVRKKSSVVKTCERRVKEASVKSGEKAETINERFVRMHRVKDVANAAAKKSSRSRYDDQSLSDDEPLFKIVKQSSADIASRCTCISTIIRNLSFVPGNDAEMCANPTLMKIFSRLLIVKHTHPYISTSSTNDSTAQDDDNQSEENNENDTESEIYSDEDEEYLSSENECARRMHTKYNLFYSSRDNESSSDTEWTSVESECVAILRENTLVTLANIAGAIDLSKLDEDAQIELYSHGLLHWSICPSTEARDPLPTLAETSTLSAQRLAIETLAKMTINEVNVDLIIHTVNKMRPWLDSLIQILCHEWLPRRDEQTLRELGIVLLTAMAKCDQFAARSIARHTSSVLTFLEDFEENARRLHLHHQQHHHHHVLDEDSLGTTIEMLRRAAKCLLYVAQFGGPEAARLVFKYEQRLLDLITSQFVDAKVSQLLAEVLFHCSK